MIGHRYAAHLKATISIEGKHGMHGHKKGLHAHDLNLLK